MVWFLGRNWAEKARKNDMLLTVKSILCRWFGDVAGVGAQEEVVWVGRARSETRLWVAAKQV